MAKPRAHLRNAPIVEAIIDFRVLPRADIGAEAFAEIASAIGYPYIRTNLLQSVEARFGLNHGEWTGSPPIQSAIGWVYTKDGAVGQFRVDGFTFSKLEPYTDWKQVFSEALRLWQVYFQIARPLEVSRLAVRYINRLKVPGPTNLGLYLEAPPLLPPPIPQTLREFLSRVVVEDNVSNTSAVLVQALEASLDPSVIPLYLDIDAFRRVSLPHPTDPSLSEMFEQLRSLKNRIFFASVTERTVEMYE